MTAPQILINIHELSSTRLREDVSYDRETNRLLGKLFELLQKIEPDEHNGGWDFWLTANRGNFRDFKEHYVGYYARLTPANWMFNPPKTVISLLFGKSPI